MLSIDSMQFAHVLAILAWGLLRALLAPLFGLRRGLEDFQRSYAHDRLVPLRDAERRDLSAMSGCIACGLCNFGEGEAISFSNGAYAGAMDIALATSRNMPDFDAAVQSLAFVDDERLAHLELRCPTSVPLRRIARFVRDKAREIE